MKLLLPLLLAPVLSLAAATGSVTLLDGTPVSGAVIKSLTDSVITSAAGSFALGRTSGIASRSAKSISVTSHLTVENGRPRLSFAGMDIAGRTRSSATARQNLSSTGSTFSARSTGTPDTLKVYWKGKRLTVLPVTSDTTVTFRIDTAWKDDAGIPWNPAITYGSLYDARDGQTYRTVTIGSQTWMAENLNYAAPGDTVGVCYNNIVDSCTKYGRLYTWSESMLGSASSWTIPSGVQGLCPVGWHVPSDEEWTSSEDFIDPAGIMGGTLLSSTAHWCDGGGKDQYGFRALPGGVIFGSAFVSFLNIGSDGGWWSATDYYASYALYREINYNKPNIVHGNANKAHGISVRCLKD